MSIDVNRLGPAAQRQILQKLTGQKKESKYHSTPAQRLMPNGKIRTFSSQKEARRYDELRAAMKAGVIRGLRIQPSFTLQESYVTPDGDLVRAIKYVADFSYKKLEVIEIDQEKCFKAEEDLHYINISRYEALKISRPIYLGEHGTLGNKIYCSGGKICVEVDVVEDVKGVRTEGYKMKRKMMQDKLGISVKEV